MADKIKKPMSGYFIYKQTKYQEMKAEKPDTSYADLLKEITANWHAQSAEEK